MSSEVFNALFHPRSIAVVGASSNAVSGGNRFIRNLQAFGYEGEVYPVHPTSAEIEGLPAYASLALLPETVDYAYVATNAARVPDVIRSGRGKVRVAQVMSSGFGETAEGAGLQASLLSAAQDAGIRVVGPNCLGVYSPRDRISFARRTTDEAGPVGVICQSGGLGTDIIRKGQNRGLRFSGLVTIGNAVDISASELLEYFLNDADTAVIGMYLESAPDGRQLFELLRQARCNKPVVLLKGGGTAQGQRAASSHTGALAGGMRSWRALSRQTGIVLVETLDEFLDALLMFQCLSPRSRITENVALFGNGGGTSVLGTDAFDRAGFDVPRFSGETLAQLESVDVPPGASLLNPIDVPAGALQQNEGRIADALIGTVMRTAEVQALVVHINLTIIVDFKHVDMLGNMLRAVEGGKGHGVESPHLLLVLRSDGDPEVEEQKRHLRQRAVKAGVPVFDELYEAACALACMRHVEEARAAIG